MKKINKIDGVQNVEVSIKIPPEKSPLEQLEIMEAYTNAHINSHNFDKAQREINCLKTIYPTLFRSIEDTDMIAGRLDFLPIGFGSVTSVGGVGHYCVFHKLREFKDQLDDENHHRIDKLYDYWTDHDVKAIYCNDVLNDTTTGRFIDASYPFMATARLSGMMLDYNKLMRLGVSGLIEEIKDKEANEFLLASIESLNLFKDVISRQIEIVQRATINANETRISELNLIIDSLNHISNHPPKTFHQALQLFWLYALCAGAINYGRMDIVLGSFLKNDIDSGLISEDDAYKYLKSLWTLIENRRTTVNGRIIVGGYGRDNEEAADLFTRICLKVCKNTRYVEPQFTLRFNKDTPSDIMDMAYDCIASGATYPTLYNDDVNIEAVEYAMRTTNENAKQYVPFGCGEYVIQGKSVGTPNTLLNLLKIQQMVLNQGKDPMDNINKAGPVNIPPIETFKKFDDFYSKYKELLDYYFDLSVRAQIHSYTIMNQEVSFLFNSILMDNCIDKRKSILDGGIEILGGTNETYGNINSSDALYAIKKLVFDDNKYTLAQLNEAALQDFVGYDDLRNDLLDVAKYGNDNEECDIIANDLYEYVAKGIRDRGIKYGLGYYLMVISNNQTNTDWGLKTAASLDGRKSGVYMNPANNPQGGAAKNGPTATLNSLTTFNAKYHAGSVQNIRFTSRMMKQEKISVQSLFKTYFKKGGCQLMVTVVDPGMLEDAQKHPENYQDLIVRVAGYSAVFVNLSKEIQDELMSRALYD